jgi:hypothetical protein
MPDFGSFRGFGEKLAQGQTPTQLGLIGSTFVSDFDLDAVAFFDRVIAAGGSLSGTEQTAVNQLVLDMKAAGIWTLQKAIYPMVGASAAACAQNLRSSSFTGVFSGGVVIDSTGITPNGSNGFMNTNFIPSSNWSTTSFSYGGYTPSTTNKDGAYNGASVTSNYFMHSFRSFGSSEFWTSDGNDIIVSGGVTGFIRCNLLGTSKKTFVNNTTGGSATATTVLPTINMYIGAVNGLGFRDNKTVSFYYYSDGLTDTQAANYYTAVQAFQTTLSRQV